MKNPIGVFTALLGGVILGGVLGVLFAPESGKETRQKIADALEKRGIKLTKKEMDDLVEEIKSDMANENIKV